MPVATPDAVALAGSQRRDLPARPLPALTARRVIGFIDVGCAFANRMFRQVHDGAAPPRTRVAALWDQGGVNPQGGLAWTRPQGFDYGAQALRASTADGPGLDALLAAHWRAGVVDEIACYRAAGHQSVLASVSHGTHVMGIATGHPSPLRGIAGLVDDGAAAPPDGDIVFVSQPRMARGRSVDTRGNR